MSKSVAQLKINKALHEKLLAYRNVFASPEGQVVLEDLKYYFDRSLFIKVDGVIDPNAVIAMAGSLEVILHIEQRMRTKQDAVD